MGDGAVTIRLSLSPAVGHMDWGDSQGYGDAGSEVPGLAPCSSGGGLPAKWQDA